MFRNRRVAVVVPCYDVAARVPGVIRTLPDFVDDIVVVDDGSADDPGAAAQATGRPGIVVLRHADNRGVARAMATGFAKALELGADLIVKVDGDGQMDPSQMSTLLAPIVAGEADLTKGNRLLRRRDRAGMPWLRLVGNVILSFLTKLASGYWNIFDPTNGYVAMRRKVVEEIEIERLGPRYFFEISLLCQAYLIGAVVRDIAMPSRYGGEPSSLSPHRASITFPFLLLRACVRRVARQHFIRDFTPVALFLLSGSVLSGVGLVLGLAVWSHNSRLHLETPAGTVVLVGVLLLLGSHLLLQALVLDIGSVPSRSPWLATRGTDPRPRARKPR
jgi:dolichol-phosphate mannosyltransferase